jgi:uncharacterized protein YbjQ (UPF0145 family)
MDNSKNVLVLTTPTVDGLKIKKYLKPVSAHIVTGTNLFSDFFASFSDVFGGKSGTYQKQLNSIYTEAIEQVKYAAYEIGANCVIGLDIDLDEISGKGKSMFMLTAIGTAVIIDLGTDKNESISDFIKKNENIGLDKLKELKIRKSLIDQANSKSLILNTDIFDFLTKNCVFEVLPFVIKELKQMPITPSSDYYKMILHYIDSLPRNQTIETLYNEVRDGSESEALIISGIIKELMLYDFNNCKAMLESNNFEIQKRAVRISTYDKPYYNKQDINDLKVLNDLLQKTFVERGLRTSKKQFLSSNEKQLWNCECGNSNSMTDQHCTRCQKDIYGFKYHEMTPLKAAQHISENIDVISEYFDL